MASSIEWQRYHTLRDSIADAVDTELSDNDMTEDDIKCIWMMISPDLEEVFAWVNIEKGEIDLSAFEGWNLEYAESVEEAVDIAGLYFDLR